MGLVGIRKKIRLVMKGWYCIVFCLVKMYKVVLFLSSIVKKGIDSIWRNYFGWMWGSKYGVKRRGFKC